MLIDFYLENLTKNKLMMLPVTPENYQVTTEKEIETVRLATIGDINIPTFDTPKAISITGIFSTNENRKLNPNMMGQDIQETIDYVNVIKEWQKSKDIIRVLIIERNATKSILDDKFYIKSLSTDGEYAALGDINYTIEFVEYREVVVGVVAQQTMRSTPSAKQEPVDSKKRTHTVVKGDSLWAIARKYYGDGNQYTKILNANKDKIKNKDLIYVGQVFDIPY